MMSYSCFQTNVLTKFVDIIYAYSSTRNLFNLCVIALNITISAPG